ncbi:multicopper oxidase family protein [Streptomyces sp. NPDC049577]|uniref:multicopper oxidase family protein n=1 Tax=Streptomyces sp. NPDC049577 TaxID=3155153 RepID=UPI003449D3E0
MLNRRNLIKIGAVGGAVALLPLERVVAEATAKGPAGAGVTPLGDPAPAATFAHAMPIPRVLRPTSRTASRDVYEIHMKQSQHEIVKGLQTTLKTYDGSFPGPTIKATSGREVLIRQFNDLAVDTSVHLHGGHTPSASDGLPMATIAPGTSREYLYPNRQVAASLWYHDHAHHVEVGNVFQGLHGMYHISDRDECRLPLPRGQYDVPLMIRDARIETDGSLVQAFPQFCNNMLVNGKERPYFQVAARRYRFRLYNVSINRHVTLRLADGSEFQQIASDAGLLEHPVTINEITLAGAERAEVVVDFSRYDVGDSIVLQNTAALDIEKAEVLRFDIVREAEDPSRVPHRLAYLPPVPKKFDAERNFTLNLYPKPVINGQQYDPARVDTEVKLGTTELWTITNGDTPAPAPNFHLHHSFHIHLVPFRVVERNGKPVAPGEQGLKDTVIIAPGDTVKVAIRWEGYPGEYVYHCHQLSHASFGQMARLDVKA